MQYATTGQAPIIGPTIIAIVTTRKTAATLKGGK